MYFLKGKMIQTAIQRAKEVTATSLCLDTGPAIAFVLQGKDMQASSPR